MKKDEKKRRRQYNILIFTTIKKISLGLNSLTPSFDISAFKFFKILVIEFSKNEVEGSERVDVGVEVEFKED